MNMWKALIARRVKRHFCHFQTKGTPGGGGGGGTRLYGERGCAAEMGDIKKKKKKLNMGCSFVILL